MHLPPERATLIIHDFEGISLNSKNQLKLSKKLDVFVDSEPREVVFDVSSSMGHRRWSVDPSMCDISPFVGYVLTESLSSEIWPNSVLLIQPYQHHSLRRLFSPNVIQAVEIKAEDLLKSCAVAVPGETLGDLPIVCIVLARLLIAGLV